MDRRASAILMFNQGSELATAARRIGADLTPAFQMHANSILNDDTLGVGWFETANDLADLQFSAAAAASMRRALELPDGEIPGDMRPEYRARAWTELAYRTGYILGRHDEALRHIGKALELDPKNAMAWNVSSLLASQMGHHADAVYDAETAHRLAPDNPTIETALALTLLFDGQFKRGLKHFEARYSYKLKHFLNFPYPQWKGEEGKTLYLVADQGLGDTLSFARFAAQAIKRSKFVFMGVQKELIRLFKAAFQGFPNLEILAVNGNPFPPADCWTTFVSLPTALDLSEDEIVNARHILLPKLQPTSMTWKSPSRRLHIGVAWRGSTASDIDHLRSFNVEHLLQLYRIPGVQLYSMQIDQRGDEIFTAGAPHLIRDLRPFIMDVADTTAILSHLDLVVTVESALGHIAGLCGTRTIIPYSARGHDYRLGRDGEHIIWYPNHSIVKQKMHEPWEVTFDRVVDAVREIADGK